MGYYNIHIVEVDAEPGIQSSVTRCSRCFLDKEIGEMVIYVFAIRQEYLSRFVEAYDICKDCLPFVKAEKGNKEVEAHRQRCKENPYTYKDWDGTLKPYLHFNRARWRTTNQLMKGDKLPDYNTETDPPVPGVTTWLVHKDGKEVWEERPAS